MIIILFFQCMRKFPHIRKEKQWNVRENCVIYIQTCKCVKGELVSLRRDERQRDTSMHQHTFSHHF